MPVNKRFTNEQILAAYSKTGSVWKAAKLLGACGQSVWERLKRLGHVLPGQEWTAAEVQEITALAGECTLGDISRRMGRSYASVACKISELGLGVRYGNNLGRKAKRVPAVTKAMVDEYFFGGEVGSCTVSQYCIRMGLDLESFVQAAQSHAPEAWSDYVRSHSDLAPLFCPQCKTEFIPMTRKQKVCSRKCGSDLRKDTQYFGGKRSTTVGLAEGICQVCGAAGKESLASHHVLGKQNDPDNDHLVAVCRGCHSIVGSLAGKCPDESEAFWENLILLVMARKLGHRIPAGFNVSVDIEELSIEDLDLTGVAREFARRINEATGEQVAQAMESCSTPTLEWAVRFEAGGDGGKV